MASSSNSIQRYALSTVKWDMQTFFSLIQSKIHALGADGRITREDWQKVAAAVSHVVGAENPNVLLFREPLEFYLKEVQKQVVREVAHPDMEQILKKTGELFRHTFEEIHVTHWKDGEPAQFIRLYRDFVEKNGSRDSSFSSDVLRGWIPSRGDGAQKSEFDCLDIDRELPLEEVNRRYQQTGIIQLREINPDATTLILGCGNGRLSDDGGTYPIEWEDPEQSAYSVQHNHPRNVVTVDAALSANPTICAFIGNQPIAHIFKGKKFDTIILESMRIDPDNPIFQNDLKLLMNPHCRIFSQT